MSNQNIEELLQRLQAKEKEARYYERIAREAGDRRLRETELLSRLSSDLRKQLATTDSQRIELAGLYKTLERNAVTDELTSLLNRRGFIAHAEREFARFRRRTCKQAGGVAKSDDSLTFAIFDIDNFKDVNDTHGHQAGDLTLCEFGAILRRPGLLRETDVVGRYGGDEFVAFLPACAEGSALEPLERLRRAVRDTKIQWKDGIEISITISIGVSEARPEDADIYSPISRADEALYVAKDGGKDQLVIHSSPTEK